ncbi:hypothetical protein GR702_20695 [Novosphingobium sp. FGD1]|jgi:hypothetical protein|uniref:Uncharacterized protein n=1 Tax=Novosphingobium silvae TaxID=2692619 RepID=A0A7X4GL07_9SPHN|nr:hypothetical protein [Novosphingobium silvae]MYM00175.1 hypothetical protein [Novosphingobium silvae]
MSSRTATTASFHGAAQLHGAAPVPAANGAFRSRLDWAIIVSLLSMGALNLYVMADQFGPAKAYAAPVKTHACGAPLA